MSDRIDEMNGGLQWMVKSYLGTCPTKYDDQFSHGEEQTVIGTN